MRFFKTTYTSIDNHEKYLSGGWSDSGSSGDSNIYRSPQREWSHLATTDVPTEVSTFTKAYFNLTVCILASALLSMPFGFDKSGWLGGTVLLIIVGALVDYTLICLGDTCMALEIFDYQALAEHSFGKPGRYIQALVQLSLSLSLMVSYQIIAANNIKNLLSSTLVEELSVHNFPLQIILVMIITVCLLVPLATLASLRVLGYSSMISVMAVIILTISLLYFDLNRQPPNAIQAYNPNFFMGISVFATGFVCHQIITPTLESLHEGRRSRKDKFHWVVHFAIFTSFILFAAVGTLGYYLCNGATKDVACPGNILDWSDPRAGSVSDSSIGKIAIVMFTITALFAYPLEHFSCYNTLCKLMYKEDQLPGRATGLVLKLGLVILTTCPALIITDIGPLIAWTGNLAAFPLGFILPLSIALQSGSPNTSAVETAFRVLLLGATGILMVVQILHQLSSDTVEQ